MRPRLKPTHAQGPTRTRVGWDASARLGCKAASLPQAASPFPGFDLGWCGAEHVLRVVPIEFDGRAVSVN